MKGALNYTLTSEPALFADRGFTAHEFLADFNLYNMNGRLYDPVVGRFLSPDPYIQTPSFSQSYNRYSYALNNPLKFTDYTRESWKSFWNKIGNWFTRNNIQFQVGVNISGNGTVPFAGVSGPNNFNLNTQNFVKQPTAGYQRINEQLAGFGSLDWKPLGFGDIINQQFVGESPFMNAVASSNTGTEWMTFAESQLGVTEINGLENNPDIINYHKTTGRFNDDETAWCSSFVNWTFTQAGIKGTNSARAYAWKTWGFELNEPAFGAVAIMNYSHVGFVAGMNNDGRIILLGGNQGPKGFGAVNYSPNNINFVIMYRYPIGYSPNYSLPRYNLKGRSLDLNSTH